MGRKIKTCPPGADLTGRLRDIAARHGVSLTTAREWKRNAGIPPNRTGARYGSKRPDLCRMQDYAKITPEDWAKGNNFVGNLLGVGRERARQIRLMLGIPARYMGKNNRWREGA